MAAVTVTTGYPKAESMGSITLYTWRVTSVDDTDTLATGLGGRLREHWVEWTGDPVTSLPIAGGHSAESAGTITFYPSSSGHGATVFVIGESVAV